MSEQVPSWYEKKVVYPHSAKFCQMGRDPADPSLGIPADDRITRAGSFGIIVFIIVMILIAGIIIFMTASRGHAETRCWWLGKEYICKNGSEQVVCWKVGSQWVCRNSS